MFNKSLSQTIKNPVCLTSKGLLAQLIMITNKHKEKEKSKALRKMTRIKIKFMCIFKGTET